MKASELRDKTSAELNELLVDLKTQLFNLRFQLATGQLDNTSKINFVKKDIARVKTIIREQELNINVH